MYVYDINFSTMIIIVFIIVSLYSIIMAFSFNFVNFVFLYFLTEKIFEYF